ncbi:MAG: chorismate synthase [Flavobacteriales bacterium]|nr:chorismate synthase [Flavobacteriales bacterium]
MAGNTFGTLFRLTTFGESHGIAIGGILDGCPAGLLMDIEFIQQQLDYRKPGQSKLTTQRKEEDQVEFLSGIFEGKTTGTPIGFLIQNKDQKSKDYSHIKDTYRPSHADFVYEEKYGNRDYRGGGRSSARETACRVVAGAIAQLLLKEEGVEIHSYVQQVGHLTLLKEFQDIDFSKTFKNDVRCPDETVAEQMEELIKSIKKDGDTIGGTIQTLVRNCPIGLGEPVFDKLHADLAKGMMSINAVKGFEYGSGFCAPEMKGSQHNDEFIRTEEGTKTKTNYSGGIQGGISNGEQIYFRTAFKPVATIMKDQDSVNKEGEKKTVKGKGRHDACVVPRAVPIVTAMTALVLADHWLRSKTSKL